MDKIKYREKETTREFPYLVVLALITASFIMGFLIGITGCSEEAEEIKSAQNEIRLELKTLKEKGELARIIDGLLRERKQIIDWNRENIIVTVEPMKPDTEEPR